MAFAVFLACAVWLLFFYGLGDVGLLGPDEPRYAQVAREMLRSGDYITPHLNGEPWLEKPPLYYWLAAASFRLFGVTEWSARLPSALAAAAFLPLFGWVVRRLFRGETWRYALLVLASSLGWLGFARGVSPDIFFSAALAGALGLLAVWVWQGHDSLLYGFYALLAIAVLAKGPVAIVLSALVLLSYCLATGEYRWLLRVLAPWPLLLFLLLTLPWYVAVYSYNGDRFVEEFILKHHFSRYLTSELKHPGPWWYYLPVLLAGMFPWSAHLALIVANMAGLGWRGLRNDQRRLFLLAWIVPVVLFFSASQAKLPGYVLVTVPAMAIWIGEELARAPASRLRWVFLGQALLLPATAVLVGVLPLALAEGARSALAEVGAQPLDGRMDGPLVALTVVGAVLLVTVTWRGRRLGATLLATALTAATFVRLFGLVAAPVDQLASARPLARQIQARGIPASQLTLSPGVRRHIEYGLEFYLDHPLSRGTSAPYVLTPDGRLQSHQSQKPDHIRSNNHGDR